MIIIPAERTLDWRRPPVITLGIILLNILVFFGYQSGDRALQHHALEFYLQHDLLSIELPEYKDYLQRRIHLGQDNRKDLPATLERLEKDDNQQALSYIILADRDFAFHLKANGERFMQDDVFRQWLSDRTYLEDTWLSKTSAIRFGLTPANVDLSSLFVHQFLHGGIGHLIGNMVFLFLLGYGVEAVMGKFRFLLAYLLCGALAGLCFSWFAKGSHIPLVGASGAISGVMGMYAGIYGLRKIRFFFWAGVYFNYFRAPALWLLPVWVGKEVFEYWHNVNSNVAYMAHAGGLIAGGALVLLLKNNLVKVEEVMQVDEEEVDLEQRKAYHVALEAIGRIDFKQAAQRFQQLLETYPGNIGYMEHLYQIEKLDPKKQGFLAAADRLMSAALKSNQFDLALQTYRDAIKRFGHSSLFGEQWHYRMLMACLRNNDLKEAEAAFLALRETAQSQDMVLDACQALVTAFRQREMATKLQYYRSIAEQIEQLLLAGKGADAGLKGPAVT